MPDLVMCSGSECPIKNNCYRHRAVSNLAQPYFLYVPFNAETQTCKGFKNIGLREVMSVEDAESFWSKHI